MVAKAKNQQSEIPLAAEPAHEAPGSVDQIRDILFGRQMSEYEARFRQLEERLVKENRALREALEKRINDALRELDTERKARETGHAELISTLTSQADALRQDQQGLHKEMAAEIMEVRDHLHEQARDLEQKISHGQSDLATLLRQMADQLDNGTAPGGKAAPQG